jgi:drug/metabolite transporter (DMT)-like permease
VLLALLLAWRVPLRLKRRERIASLIIGVLLAGYAFCLYKSFEYIPVALGVLTFYTYPLLIALIAWATGQGRPTPRMAAALAVAFGGLVLALGIAGAGLDIRGILVAGLGGFGFALLLVATGRLFPGGDSRPRTLHMLASASLSYLVVCAVTGHFAWPQTSAGWIGFVASTGFYCVAIVGLFVAAGALGPVKTALILNLEPVSSVVLGFLVLDQRLTPLQLVGVALVVGAILFARSSSPGQAKR